MTRLPNLKALRAFEAAGRHLSFTRAAAELNVTQAAISHQIKALEDELGLRLFRREARGLLLTDSGQLYLPEVSAVFARLVQATERLRQREETGILTVSVLPSFAARWLVPRLRRFRAQHPEIDLRVAATDKLIDFSRDGVDLAIRYGYGDYRGLFWEHLLAEEIFPVCSPALLQEGSDGRPALRQPEDLRHHTLLHDDLRTDWAMWLKAAGVRGIDPHRGPGFTDSSMLLQAAVDGQGVALGRSALAGDDLAAGRLVRPFAFSLPAGLAYYIACPEHAVEAPKIRAFRSWLHLEAAGDPSPG